MLIPSTSHALSQSGGKNFQNRARGRSQIAASKFRTLCLPNSSGKEPSSFKWPTAIPLVHQSTYKWNKEAGKLASGVENADDKNGVSHTLQLVPEAIELLKTIKKPVAVLSVCGPYRSGKSFSRVVEKPGTFMLGHSMEAWTRGVKALFQQMTFDL